MFASRAFDGWRLVQSKLINAPLRQNEPAVSTDSRRLAVHDHFEVVGIVDHQGLGLGVRGLASMKTLEFHVINIEGHLDEGRSRRCCLGLGQVDVLEPHAPDGADAFRESPVVEIDPVHAKAAAQAAHGDILDRLVDAQEADKGVGVGGLDAFDQDVTDRPATHAEVELALDIVIGVERDHVVAGHAGGGRPDAADHAALREAADMHTVLIDMGAVGAERDVFNVEVAHFADPDEERLRIVHGQVADGQVPDIDEVDGHAGVGEGIVVLAARVADVVGVPHAAPEREIPIAVARVGIGNHEMTAVFADAVRQTKDGTGGSND